MSSPRPAVTRTTLVVAASLLLALFTAFALYQGFWAGRVRSFEDVDLLAELAEATLVEDEPPPAGDWTGWRGPRRDGVAFDPAFLTAWPDAGPKQAWKIDGGDGYSSFCVAGGLAFTNVGGDETESVLALSLSDGSEKWRLDLPSGNWASYPGPRATPSFENGKLYVAGSAGSLLRIDVASGKPDWKRDLRSEMGATPPRWGMAFSPLVEGDLVYAVPGGGKGHCVAAFDKNSGSLVWSSLDDQAGYSSPVVATLGGRRQVVMLTGDRLVGLSPDKGELLWSAPWSDQFKVNAATPLIVHAQSKDGRNLGYVFISSGYDLGCALYKVEATEGGLKVTQVYFKSHFRLKYTSPVRYRDHLYGLDEKEGLTCLNFRTGAVAWRKEASGRGQQIMQGALLRVNDKLLIQGERGRVRLAECDPAEYREVASFQAFRAADQRNWSLPVVAAGKMLLRDRRSIACYDVR